jgi:hypothetical protein
MLLSLLLIGCVPPSDTGATSPMPENSVDTAHPCHATLHFQPPTGAAPPFLSTPTWESLGETDVFSSPRLADLDGDGLLDVVSGHGTSIGGDLLQTVGYATALSGETGEPLWRVEARQEVFSTAALPDLTGDGVADPVFGGRHAELFAVNGATGAVLWTFDMDVHEARDAGWYNTFSPQTVADRNGDGVPDLLIANGGDFLMPPDESERPPGRLALISGATGAVLSSALVPDRRETYLSPVLLGADVIFGTGGETVAGSLWRASLDDIARGDLDDAVALLDGELGAIAPPSMTDLNDDCIDDIVVANFSGTLAAIDGATNEVLWRVEQEGQTYNSPTLGFFTEDGIPDVFGSVMEGSWPVYERMVHRLIDGATGAVLWTGELGVFGSSGSVAVDLDGDGRDEVILGVNDSSFGSDEPPRWQLHHFDPVLLTLTPIADLADRAGVANPWIGDLDGDGLLELVTNTADLTGLSGEWKTERFDLDVAAPPSVSWGSYLGTHGDGRFVY